MQIKTALIHALVEKAIALMEMIKDSEKEEVDVEPLHTQSFALLSDSIAASSPRSGIRTLKKAQQQSPSVLRSLTPRWTADMADAIKQQFTTDGVAVPNTAQPGDGVEAQHPSSSDLLSDGLLVLLTETLTELAKWTDPASEKDVLTVYVEHESRKGRPAIALQALLKQLDGLDAKSTTKAHLAARNQLVAKLGWEHAVSYTHLTLPTIYSV